MNRITRRNFTGRILLGSVLALSLAAAASAAKAENFVVGVIGSLTGPAASFDVAVVDGVKAALQYWNDNGGYKGRKIEARVLDDESQPANSVTVYRRLTDDPNIHVIIACSASSSLVAIKAIADELKTPTTGSATHKALANPPAKYFFRTLPSSDAYMTSLMSWVKHRGYKTMGIINPSDVVGQREAEVIKELGKKMGVKIVAAESYNNSDTNFTAQLVNIRNAKPDFVYAGVIGGPSVLVFKQIKQLKLTMPLAIHSSSFNQRFYTNIGGKDKAEGVYTPIERGGLGSVATGRASALYKAASKNLGHPATNLNTAGFDTGLIVMDAVNRSDGTREGIRDQLDATKNLPVIGGFVSYSPTDHRGKDERAVAVAQLVNGSFIEAK